MNDYKDLVNNLLRHYPDEYWALQAVEAIVRLTNKYEWLDEFNAGICKESHKLKKERDAAIADIEKHCHNCKNSFLFNNGRRCPYLKECRIPECDRWEWRGVQEVEYEAD